MLWQMGASAVRAVHARCAVRGHGGPALGVARLYTAFALVIQGVYIYIYICVESISNPTPASSSILYLYFLTARNTMLAIALIFSRVRSVRTRCTPGLGSPSVATPVSASKTFTFPGALEVPVQCLSLSYKSNE